MSNVRDFGAVGDGRANDTAAIQHAIDDGDGAVELSRGDYRITKSLRFDLRRTGRASLSGSGGVAKLIMDAPGPAVAFNATHGKTADPSTFRPEEWQKERMPTVSGIEVVGKHAEADGIRIVGVMQPTLTGVLIRNVRTAVHVTERARNLLIDHCHFYHNTGVGVHLDRVNLHQAIVAASHISYCRLGGIRIDNSEIRDLQITGNDIEYNNNRSHGIEGADAEPTAEIYIDVGEESVREGTIVSNTIQSTYSPGGANIRLIGRGADEINKVGMWAISGNMIGSQDTNIHLTAARGVTIAGNYIYAGHNRNLLVENSRNIVVGANCFGHNPDYGNKRLCTGIRIVDSVDCNLSGVVIQDCEPGRQLIAGADPIERHGLVEFIRCRRVNMNGSHVIDAASYGVYLEETSDTLITGCTIIDSRDAKSMKAAIAWHGPGGGNMIATCRIGRGTEGDVIAPSHVRLTENLLDEV